MLRIAVWARGCRQTAPRTATKSLERHGTGKIQRNVINFQPKQERDKSAPPTASSAQGIAALMTSVSAAEHRQNGKVRRLAIRCIRQQVIYQTSTCTARVICQASPNCIGGLQTPINRTVSILQFSPQSRSKMPAPLGPERHAAWQHPGQSPGNEIERCWL